jgi:uncharacterized iron-regulated membrane protein
MVQASLPARIDEVRLVSDYEAYYTDRRHEKPLPVWFVKLNDPESSSFYIDPKTGRVVANFTSAARWNRWLYHGLHSLDLPWLYRYRPAWDIVVLALMFGGTALCVTSVVIGWRRLRKKASIHRAALRLRSTRALRFSASRIPQRGLAVDPNAPDPTAGRR